MRRYFIKWPIGLMLFMLMDNAAMAQTIEPQSYANVTDVLPPPPNAAALGKYGGIEVSLNTGMVNKSITICALSTSNISVPVTLSYSSNGFKPSEMASRAGMGWVLNAGGVVTRTIVGEADEYYTRKAPPMTLARDSVSFDFLYKSVNGYWDVQPDIYSFNFNGYTGRFVYNENDSIFFMPANTLKVEKSLFSADWNFKITTPDGLVYYFGGSTATEQTKSEGGCGKDFGPSYRPSSWYLKKIKSPLGDSVVFQYQSLLYDYPGLPTENLYANGLYNINDPSGCADLFGNFKPCADYASQSRLCGATYRTLGVLLTEIQTPNAGSIKFDYTYRVGYADKLHSKVTLLDQNAAVKSIFELNYTQVYTTLFNNTYSANSTRPFLTKIAERSTDLVLTREHDFYYHKLDSLPVENSYGQDYWGYFNGKNNSSLVEKPDDFYLQATYPTAIADRSINGYYARFGMLTKIRYPTGGIDSIEYEPNTYYGQQEIKPAITELGLTATGTGFNTAVITNSSNIAVTYQHSVKLTFTMVDNSGGTYDPLHNKGIITVTNVTTNTIVLEKVYVPDGVTRNEVVTFYSGNTYKVSVTANGSAVTTNATVFYRSGSATTYTGNIETAGLRVKRVTTRTDAGVVPVIKRYYYASSIDSLSYSSGALPATPNNIREFSSKFACYVVPLEDPQCGYRFCNYGHLQSASFTTIHTYPSGYSYGVVIEAEGDNFENGAIEHRYTIKPDQGPINLLSAFSGDLIGGTNFFNDSYYNGLEVRRTVFKKSEGLFIPIEKVENNYKIDSRRSRDIYGAAVMQRFEWCQGFANNPTEDMINAFNANLYAHQSRWVYIDTVKTTLYDPNGTVARVSYQYSTYGNSSHMQPTNLEVTSGEGELVGNEIRYPGDYGSLSGMGNITVGIKNLQTLGISSVPVESVTYRRQEGANTRRVVSAKFTAYKTTLPLPDTLFQVETTTVITDFNLSSNASGSVSKDSRYKRQISFLQYDSRGNLLSQQKEGEAPVSYIWDYKNTYPVAQAGNAAYADIAYTSFESTGTGNWTFSGGAVDNSYAITGLNGYLLSTGNSISKLGLTSGTTYVVSYWSRNGSLTVNSGSGTAGPTRNGWTYYSHTVSGASTITVTKSGSAVIDELRLYPVGALMTTATYDLLRGASSQNDVLNKITYYSYDGFGRLYLVRDELGAIVKRICYNYMGQPEYCNTGTVYYNVAKSNTYTRNNCPVGYAGSTVTYTIPANSYASLISQLDADQQAQDALTANGQNYANENGTCVLLYYNVAKSGTFTRNNCGNAYTGGTVTYTVPAGTYSSTISQADADLQAQNAVTSNGQSYANTNGSCTLTCHSGNCSGNNKKCINGNCETGVKVYTGYVQIGTRLYECTYHYEWSDGSWSSNYTEQSSLPCIGDS